METQDGHEEINSDELAAEEVNNQIAEVEGDSTPAESVIEEVDPEANNAVEEATPTEAVVEQTDPVADILDMEEVTPNLTPIEEDVNAIGAPTDSLEDVMTPIETITPARTTIIPETPIA